MLRSILVALDDSEASKAAQEVAIDLAKRFRAQITGFAVLDRPHITAPTPVGIGGLAYKRHRDQVMLQQAHTFLERLERRFEASAEALGTDWQVIEAEGVPHELLQSESRRHDLLVVGRDTDFHFGEHPHVAGVVYRLTRDNPLPLIVCPDSAKLEGPIIAATDGSPRASRTLHLLILLGIAQDRPVHVLSIAHGQEDADRWARISGGLLEKHGLEVHRHGVCTSANPAEIMLEYIERLGAAMLAMGAGDRGALHDFFMGSVTRDVLNDSPCPVFLYH